MYCNPEKVSEGCASLAAIFYEPRENIGPEVIVELDRVQHSGRARAAGESSARLDSVRVSRAASEEPSLIRPEKLRRPGLQSRHGARATDLAMEEGVTNS